MENHSSPASEMKTDISISERDHGSPKSQKSPNNPMLYGLDDVPPWYLCLLLGFQHYLEMIGASVACPFLLTKALCMEENDPNKANIISTLIFISGILTIMQSTFGSRLPIVQGGSFAYLVPTLAILNLPQWKCPPGEDIAGMSPEEKAELWQVRMREIQGAIIFAALFEAIFAITGVIGFLVKFITPLTIAPAITLIGLSLFKNVSEQCSKNYIVAFSMVTLMIVFSQHLKNVKIPVNFGKPKEKGKANGFPLFQVFPLLLSLIIVWGVCGILTATNVLKEGDPARADFKMKILEGSAWFRIPYPFQWGWPTVSIGAVLGVFCGVLTSTIESIGDYYACASIAKAPVPPPHAVSRGIFAEGVGCVLSGIWGSGCGLTSYSSNIGTVTITRVASRRVIQVAGVLMIVLSLVGKAGAIFIGIPDPILGGMFCFIFPVVMAVGIGTLSEICMESSRNIFIVSFSIFSGLAISQWMANNPGAVQTGSPQMDSLIQIILSTGMFVGGITGFILDNTISGTDAERGFTVRHAADQAGDPTYDLPFGMNLIKKIRFLRFLPISPTYEPSRSKIPRTSRENDEDNSENHCTSTLALGHINPSFSA